MEIADRDDGRGDSKTKGAAGGAADSEQDLLVSGRPLTMTPLIDALNVRAISAYERQDASALPGLRSLGAALGLHGIAENGGLVGGGIENLFFSENLSSIDDAIGGYRWLGLSDVAGLVTRARGEYLRFRPTGWEELSDADALLWEQLDSAFSTIAPLERLEAAVAARLHEIAPEMLPS